MGKDSGFPGEDSGEGFDLCGRIRAFVKRILGFRVMEFGRGEGLAVVGRLSGFRGERLGLSCGGFWAFVKVAGFPVEDLGLSCDGIRAFVARVSGCSGEGFGLWWKRNG